MARALSEKERKRRRYRRRRRIALLIAVLLLAGIVALIVWLISLLGGGISLGLSGRPAAPTRVAVTTTYPSLEASEVDGQLHMNSVLLYDETHDAVLYQSNANELAYPASLTKMLTASVAVRYCPADTHFTVGTEQSLVEWDASSAYLEEGTTWSLPAMLDALLLPSGADAAYCLAVNTARIHSGNAALSDEEAVATFVNYMNEVAAELGCTGSNFVTPDGYHDPNHVTTAADMLKIARHAYSLEPIRNCVRKGTSEYGDWNNGNFLVRPDLPDYYDPQVIGLKTGYTDEAGFCLAAAAENEGTRLFVILLGSDSTEYRFFDAASLFERGFELARRQATATTFGDYLQYFTTTTKN